MLFFRISGFIKNDIFRISGFKEGAVFRLLALGVFPAKKITASSFLYLM